MFSADDFEIPLEKQLKMRVVLDEIDKCSDVKQLQDNLKECAKSLQTYQHLLTITLQKQLQQELMAWNKEVMEHINATTDIFE